MDLSKLDTGEKVIGASGVLLLVASFLPWFTLTIDGTEVASWNGWEVGFVFGKLPVLLGLVMVAHVGVSRFMPDLTLPELPWPTVHLAAGLTAAALLVAKLAAGAEDGVPFLDIDVDRAFGLVLATLAGLGLGAGGVLYNRARSGSSGSSASTR